MWALIYNGVVKDIVAESFPVHSSYIWVETQDESVVAGSLYIDGVFSPPPPFKPKQIPDDVFRRAVKVLLKAIMQYIAGDITKVQLRDVYLTIQETIETINT